MNSKRVLFSAVKKNRYELFSKSPCRLFQVQFSETPLFEIRFKHSYERTYLLPMNSETGRKAVLAAEKVVKKSMDLNISRK